MNGCQRIKAAMEGRFPDVRPVMLHNFMMAAREAGCTMAQFREDPQKIAASFIQAIETYHYDGIVVDIDTATLAGAVGVSVTFPEDQPARAHGQYLSRLEDAKRLSPVDISVYRYVQNWLNAVRILKDHFSDEVCIRGNCDQAPFSLASMMRTPQVWMMDLLTDEDNAFALLGYCTDVTCQFIRLMAQTGCHMVSNGDSPAGPELISPQMYRRFALPYERRVVEEAHRLGLPYTLHICGKTDAILGDMLETGADCLELDYKTDIGKVFSLLKDRRCLIGNIDPSGVLAHGATAEVIRKTKRILDIYRSSPRLIVNAGCAIPAETPSENLKAMIATARQSTFP
ncbi:MAG: uroporphyrinogen decarboxylase family protein [Phycisphaerales bacterium]